MNKKVIIAIPCLLRGGTERQSVYLARALSGAGYAVTTVCYFESDPLMAEEFRDAGSEVVLLQLPRSVSAISLVNRLRVLFKRIDPWVVHVQYIAPGFLAILAARLAGVRNVLSTVHQPGTFYGPLAHVLIRCSLALCRYFIAVSMAAESSWFRSAGLFVHNGMLNTRKHFTIYDAVDISMIESITRSAANEASQVQQVPAGKQVIGTVARLSPEKGVDLLIRAFALLSPGNPEAHLLVVGTGPEEEKLKELAIRKGVAGRITWIGKVSWAEAMRLMSLMDIVACPSRFEGFGLTAAEAMAMGKLVVASEVGGLKEIISPGETGVLVDARDERAFSSALAAWLPHSAGKDTITAAAVSSVRNNFSFQVYESRILQLYKTLYPS
jgi:L-malate glycosyltransferase